MFTVKRASDNRLDVSVSGKLDDVDAVQMIGALLTQAEGIVNGRMLIDVDDFQLPTLGAFRVELSFFPELLHFSRQFTHAAVLADETWVRALSSMESKLIPGLVIKSFRKDQRYQAESWLGSV
jgi:hypothetical protein